MYIIAWSSLGAPITLFLNNYKTADIVSLTCAARVLYVEQRPPMNTMWH